MLTERSGGNGKAMVEESLAKRLGSNGIAEESGLRSWKGHSGNVLKHSGEAEEEDEEYEDLEEGEEDFPPAI